MSKGAISFIAKTCMWLILVVLGWVLYMTTYHWTKKMPNPVDRWSLPILPTLVLPLFIAAVMGVVGVFNDIANWAVKRYWKPPQPGEILKRLRRG